MLEACELFGKEQRDVKDEINARRLPSLGFLLTERAYTELRERVGKLARGLKVEDTRLGVV